MNLRSLITWIEVRQHNSRTSAIIRKPVSQPAQSQFRLDKIHSSMPTYFSSRHETGRVEHPSSKIIINDKPWLGNWSSWETLELAASRPFTLWNRRSSRDQQQLGECGDLCGERWCRVLKLGIRVAALLYFALLCCASRLCVYYLVGIVLTDAGIVSTYYCHDVSILPSIYREWNGWVRDSRCLVLGIATSLLVVTFFSSNLSLRAHCRLGISTLNRCYRGNR